MTTYELSGQRVWVAGHRGMVGQAIVRRLALENCTVLTATRDTVDLRNQASVYAWMNEARPQVVFHAAATVGGILANSTRPAEFLYDNLMIGANVIEAAREFGVEKLVYLGSSCIYPKFAPQPIPESALLSGPLEPTNEWYAVAKIACIKLCQAYRAQYGCDFIAAQPTNLYGPGDNFDLASSHVLPALLRKAEDAKISGKSMTVWGTGSALREFLYVDDLADALVFLARTYSESEIVNIGTGEEITIGDLTKLIGDVVGFKGGFDYDRSKPDGSPRKLVDITKLHNLGWKHKMNLREGIEATYRWYLEQSELRGVSHSAL
ncbi:GDP-L-fucose synthase family protein [Oryzicola mucosus]|uniref:GDP-L-fucose synthase n=1 Tax=Oryzicola mucosus TaxID=2767425 RepID=A0A8J6PL78_9HYPH|nr:GDP-L-fucose synthase [Oryzicola mucosus]MBD0413482.1 GDP-L-fucose synthase [Oryzicola mucosus]